MEHLGFIDLDLYTTQMQQSGALCACSIKTQFLEQGGHNSLFPYYMAKFKLIKQTHPIFKWNTYHGSPPRMHCNRQ